MVYAESGGVPAFTTVLAAKSEENPMFGALSLAVGNFGKAALPMAGYYQDIVCENLANAWSGTLSVEDSLEQLQQECEDEKESRGL